MSLNIYRILIDGVLVIITSVLLAHYYRVTNNKEVLREENAVFRVETLSKTEQDELHATAQKLMETGKGILAADESVGTIGKRFATIGMENNAKNRRNYRHMLFTTPNISQYISGIILHEETFSQSDDAGKPFVDIIREAGMLLGIKLDKGLEQFDGGLEYITRGLNDLKERALYFKKGGCQFAKWRCVYVLCDGEHNLEKVEKVTEHVLTEVYKSLHDHNVYLEGTLLKPNMVIPGSKFKGKFAHDRIAKETLRALRRTVPPAVPGILFLSGGQVEIDATRNLNEINKIPIIKPWKLSFSFGRALQTSALNAWIINGPNEAQAIFRYRAKCNALAAEGDYIDSL